MKVLFLESEPVWINGLPNGFRDAGHEVMISGPLTQDNIPKMISEFRPDLIVTTGWTPDTMGDNPDWIRKAVKAAGVPHAYWSVEDPAYTYSFCIPLIRRMQPDFVFTICPAWVNNYRDIGIKAAHLEFGFHPSVHYYTTPEEEYKCSVAVVANAYPESLRLYPHLYRIQSIKTLITPLIMSNIRVDFFGTRWDEISDIVGRKIPEGWIHGFLPYTMANKVYSSTDIMIGLQNYRTQVTQRTYEITGSGGFLITADTPAVRRIFTPGSDLVVSSSPMETLRLVKYYLRENNKRNKIREQGQKSAEPYHYANRARYMIDVLKKENILK